MPDSSDPAKPSQVMDDAEKLLHGSLLTARWDAVSPGLDESHEAREKTRANVLSTRLHDLPARATEQALLDGQRYRRDTVRRNNSKRADTYLDAEPRRVTKFFFVRR